MSAGAHDLEVGMLVLGGVLIVGALGSGFRRPLPVTALAVIVGFVLGPGALGVMHLNARSGFVADVATAALVVILFRDGLEVDSELLQTHWHLPLRKLVLAMPITAAIVALAAHTFTDLSWTESFLLGALLSPTDPILSSSVVTNPRVPRIVRHSLNLESGMNDGLALPAVLALSDALEKGSSHIVVWRFVLENVGIGLVAGVAIGFLAAWVMPRDRGLGSGIPPYQRELYAFGVALAAYAIGLAPLHGNGLIAVYVAAITLGSRRPDIRSYVEERARDIVEIVKVGIFVVFGSLLTFAGMFADGAAAVAIVAVTFLVARPVGVFAALAGTDTDTPTRAFMAWFGPKGVSTMTFSILVLGLRVGAGTEIFNLASLTVFCSIILHGATDAGGTEWIARHAERVEARRLAGASAPAGGS